jgi:hypothetical protein
MSSKPKSRHAVSIIDAMDDPHLFGKFFRNRTTWATWRVFLCALFGLPMTAEQLVVYKQCTNREAPPSNGFNEAWLACGRRSGKSFILSLSAVYLACFRDWRAHLGPGERATIMIIAADRRQARVCLRYIKGLLQVEMLRELIENETAEAVHLTNFVTIEVHVASFRTTRGYAVAAALVDELAFWATDEHSAEPDREVINALRPGMAQFPNAMLLCASSPYARKGSLWSAYQKHFGKDDAPALVWQAPTRVMNPSIPQSVIDEAMADDPASAAAEYMAAFRTDIEGYIPVEVVRACVTTGTYERAPQLGVYNYLGFVDPSGGSNDSFTLAIGHNDLTKQTVVIDCLREIKPPFSPEQVCAEFADLLKTYAIHSITGDRYAGQWPVEQFGKFNIVYTQSAAPKSDLYRDLLPLLNSARIELLDNQRLISQLVGLERRVARGGRDSIDHAPNGSHDDLSNSVAGVAAALNSKQGSYDQLYIGFQDDANDKDGRDAWQALRFQQFLRTYAGMP